MSSHEYVLFRIISQHDPNDLLVCFLHPVAAEAANVVDGVLHTLGYDAVASVELLPPLVHKKSKDTGID